MNATGKDKILAAVCTLILALGIGASAFAPAERLAHADGLNAYDRTTIEEDLAGVDLSAYRPNAGGSAQLLAESGFAEYAYSDDKSLAENYGLYFYVYNPTQAKLSTRSGAHAVNMAVFYDDEGEPRDYANVAITPLDHTADYLFYKFRVTDSASVYLRTKKYAQAHEGERRYDFAGIQLWEQGAQAAQDHEIGKKFTVEGYAKGMSAESALRSTLRMKGEVSDTVELKVRHTFYRTQTSDKGAGYQNQLDTVYFSVPKKLLDTYGKLQRIKAEWWEYKTNDIIVTSDREFYDKVSPYIGVRTGEPNNIGVIPYNKEIGVSLGQDAGDYGNGMYGAKWGWNLGTGYLHKSTPALYYLFPTKDWCGISAYDPYADIEASGGIAEDALTKYIYNYDKTYENGTLECKEGKVSADLFADDIDESRKIDNASGKIQQGYSYYDFDVDTDIQAIRSWNDTKPSWWDSMMSGYGLIDTIFGRIPEETGKTFAPIKMIEAGDLDGTSEAVAERLMINAADVEALKQEYRDAVTIDGEDDEEKAVVLFRFATSDYYAAEVDIVEVNTSIIGKDKHTSGKVYRAQQSVFLNFDIIRLTFKKENGELKVIGAVSDPIDIVDPITPPTRLEETPWWIWCAIAGGVLVVALLITLTVKSGTGEE